MNDKLLFIYLKLMPFVEEDLKLLSERYDVRVFPFDAVRFTTRAGRLWGLLSNGFRQLIWLLREIPNAALIYGWFADYHVFLPTLLARLWGKPVAVPLAGLDAVVLPDLGHGVYQTWRKPLAQFVVRNASLLLPVSETMIYEENRYSAYPALLKNGVRVHVPGMDTPYEVIPFGFDTDAWPMGPAERRPVVLTVGFMEDERRLRCKGVDLLFEAARRLPEADFRVVGVPREQEDLIRRRFRPPDNVALLPPRARTELPPVYGEASVYAQLSRAEGQPNVLCEAMCCGCIPVGSAVFGIPETIGDAGFVVDSPNPDALATSIRQALEGATPQARSRARQRIVEKYTLDQRRQALSAVLIRLQKGATNGVDVDSRANYDRHGA